MRAAYAKLLEEVCVRLGFCGSVVDGRLLHIDQFVPGSGTLTSQEFADALFKAEGWDLDGLEAQTFRFKVREAFVWHMGTSAVDASQL